MKSHSSLTTKAMVIILLLIIQLPLKAQTAKTIAINETHLIMNADFETGNLKGWKYWKTRSSVITKESYSGQYAVKIGPERGFCIQETKVRSNSLYRISAYIKTESGAEEVQLMVSNYGGPEKSVSSALTEYI